MVTFPHRAAWEGKIRCLVDVRTLGNWVYRDDADRRSKHFLLGRKILVDVQ